MKGALLSNGCSGADGHDAGVPPRPRSLYWAGAPRALSAGWGLTGWHPFLPRLGACTPTAPFPGWCQLSTDQRPASQAPVSSKLHSEVPVNRAPGGSRGRQAETGRILVQCLPCPGPLSPLTLQRAQPPPATQLERAAWLGLCFQRTEEPQARCWGDGNRTQFLQGNQWRAC